MSNGRKKLTVDQMVAVEWLSKPRQGGKTKEEIAAICGVSRSTLYNWIRLEEFDQALMAEMRRANRDRLPELIESLVDIAIEEKSAAMAKLALQVNGMLVDRHEVNRGAPEVQTIDYDELDEEIAGFAALHLNDETEE